MSKTGKNPNPNPGSSDPRLRSFLRQAAAIISAERGLNERSRVKLQSLADRIGLPQELLDVALVQLQQSDEAFVQLNHWERDFIKQLYTTFGGLSKKILTVSGEARIVANAESRFQIDQVRARQLIDHCAEKMGIARVSIADAKEYVAILIGQKIGDLTSIDDQVRSDLYQVGREWGVDSNFVDQHILDVLNANRLKFRPGRNSRVVVLSLMTTVMAIAIIGASVYWWRSQATPDDPTGKKKTIEPGAAAVITLLPSWWSDETGDLVDRQVDRKTWMAELDGDLRSGITEQRQRALIQVIQQACSEPVVDEPELFQLIALLLLDEPNDDVFANVTKSTIRLLTPRSQSVPSLIGEVQESLSAGRLVLEIDRALRVRSADPARGNSFRQAITVHFGEGISKDSATGTYVAKQVTSDYWNQLIQTSWASPGRASNLLKPLLDLSKNLFSPVELNQFRSRALLSILTTDASQWRGLESIIINAVESADEVKLQHWITIYNDSQDREFQDFIGPRLLAQSGHKERAVTRQEISDRLAEVQAEFRYRRHQSLLDRHRATRSKVDEALNSLNIEGNLDRPNVVASLMHLSNQSLSLAIQAKHAPAYQFNQFDRLASDPFKSLSESISLSSATQNRQASGATPPSVSELKNKSEWIGRLVSSDSSPSSRQSALDRLANLAHRFDDLEYNEAATLARYFLSDLKLGEWLNVEKNLSSFRHWPSLGLAIADELPRSTTSMEQVQSLLGVLIQEEFSLEQNPNWRGQLSTEVVKATSLNLESRLRRDPPADYLDWQRLKLFTSRAYALRYRLLQGLSTRASRLPVPRTSDPVELARWSSMALESDRSDLIQDSVANISVDSFDNEFERLISLNQNLLESMRQLIEKEYRDSANDAKQIVDAYVAIANVRTQNGERLLLVERAWLQLCELYRERLIRELLERT